MKTRFEPSISRAGRMSAAPDGQGMDVKRDVDSAAFQESTRPVWEAVIARPGDDVVNAIPDAEKM